MRIKKFNENFNQDSIFKSKDELDNMDKEEISEFRLDLIRNHYDEDTKEYLEELEFYTDVRFADEIYARYDRWLKQYERDRSDMALKLVCDILSKEDGKNNLYYLGIVSKLKTIGNFKYIDGIHIDIPDKYKEAFKYV